MPAGGFDPSERPSPRGRHRWTVAVVGGRIPATSVPWACGRASVCSTQPLSRQRQRAAPGPAVDVVASRRPGGGVAGTASSNRCRPRHSPFAASMASSWAATTLAPGRGGGSSRPRSRRRPADRVLPAKATPDGRPRGQQHGRRRPRSPRPRVRPLRQQPASTAPRPSAALLPRPGSNPTSTRPGTNASCRSGAGRRRSLSAWPRPSAAQRMADSTTESARLGRARADRANPWEMASLYASRSDPDDWIDRNAPQLTPQPRKDRGGSSPGPAGPGTGEVRARGPGGPGTGDLSPGIGDAWTG